MGPRFRGDDNELPSLDQGRRVNLHGVSRGDRTSRRGRRQHHGSPRRAPGQRTGIAGRRPTPELAASRELPNPSYEVVGRTGAHHNPCFTVRVSIPKLGEAEAEGSSKQDAETEAAKALLHKLK